MLSLQNIFDTIAMVDKQHLDIRTITMGISLLDCVSEDPKRCCDKIYDKICRRAQPLCGAQIKIFDLPEASLEDLGLGKPEVSPPAPNMLSGWPTLPPARERPVRGKA